MPVTKPNDPRPLDVEWYADVERLANALIQNVSPIPAIAEGQLQSIANLLERRIPLCSAKVRGLDLVIQRLEPPLYDY